MISFSANNFQFTISIESFIFCFLRRIKKKRKKKEGLHDWVAIDFIANYDLTHKFIPYTLHVIFTTLLRAIVLSRDNMLNQMVIADTDVTG